MHRRGSSHTRGGLAENPTKPSTCRAEKEDENRGVFGFVFGLFLFVLYGGGVGEVS